MTATRRRLRTLLFLTFAMPLTAQAPLSLQDAIRRADTLGYANRIATASASAADARAAATLRGILPTIRTEAGWVRSTDPLAAFGFQIRQRLVTPQAFAPELLNSPAPRSDLGTGVIVEVPLLNLDARAGRAAARHVNDAASENAAWVASGTRLDVVRAYYGAVLASNRVATLASANDAARGHVRQAESAETNGMVTRSDVLLAQVKQGQAETQLISARGDATLAKLRLALLLGTPGDTQFTLPSTLPVLPPENADVAVTRNRADMRTAEASVAAAEDAHRAAAAALLPRINAIARYDWHAPDMVLTGKPMWTVGLMASWSPFSGGAEAAMRRAAAADLLTAQAGRDAVLASATLEVQDAAIQLEVATQALGIATSAVAQATEAHRIVGRKYDGGLATISELLDAQATEVFSRLAEAQARYDLLIAHAALNRAHGMDLTTIAAALDAANGMREP